MGRLSLCILAAVSAAGSVAIAAPAFAKEDGGKNYPTKLSAFYAARWAEWSGSSAFDRQCARQSQLLRSD